VLDEVDADIVITPVTNVSVFVEPVADRVVAEVNVDGGVVDSADEELTDDVVVPAVGVVTTKNVFVAAGDVVVTPSVEKLEADDAVLDVAVGVIVVATAVETEVSCLVADTVNDGVVTIEVVFIIAGDVDVTPSVVELAAAIAVPAADVG